jgi:formylglycine-generating enzyme required for sulfatase activity
MKVGVDERPIKPQSPIYLALRGGSWYTRPKFIRVSIRGFDGADEDRRSGFRCARDE